MHQHICESPSRAYPVICRGLMWWERAHARWLASCIICLLSLLTAVNLGAGDAEQGEKKRVLVSIGSVVLTIDAKRELQQSASQSIYLMDDGTIEGYTFGYRIPRESGADQPEPQASPKREDLQALRAEYDRLRKQTSKMQSWRSLADISTWMVSRKIPQLKIYTLSEMALDGTEREFHYPMLNAENYRDALPIRLVINRWCGLANTAQVEDVEPPIRFTEQPIPGQQVDPERLWSIQITSMDITAGDMIMATTLGCSITADGTVTSEIFRHENLVKVQARMTPDSLALVKTTLIRLVCTRVTPEGEPTKLLQERIRKQTRIVFSVVMEAGNKGVKVENGLIDCALSPQDAQLMTILRNIGELISGLPKEKIVDLIPLLQKEPEAVSSIAYVTTYLSKPQSAVLQDLVALTGRKSGEVQQRLGKASEVIKVNGVPTREDFVVTDGKDIVYIQVLYGPDGICTGIGMDRHLWPYDPSYPGLVPLKVTMPP